MSQSEVRFGYTVKITSEDGRWFFAHGMDGPFFSYKYRMALFRCLELRKHLSEGKHPSKAKCKVVKIKVVIEEIERARAKKRTNKKRVDRKPILRDGKPAKRSVAKSKAK